LRIFFTLSIWLVCAGIFTPPVVFATAIEQVYFSVEQATQILFPEAVSTETVRFDLLTEDVTFLSGLLGTPIRNAYYDILIPKNKKGVVLGYALVLNELGKFYPITFMVGVGTDGKVVDTAIMVYREKIGADVRKKRFLNQFRKKSLENPLRPNVDVDCISGATVSSWTVTFGVKKALGVVHRFLVSTS
jgi:FAD:protein FMN transferase